MELGSWTAKKKHVEFRELCVFLFVLFVIVGVPCLYLLHFGKLSGSILKLWARCEQSIFARVPGPFWRLSEKRCQRSQNKTEHEPHLMHGPWILSCSRHRKNEFRLRTRERIWVQGGRMCLASSIALPFRQVFSWFWVPLGA